LSALAGIPAGLIHIMDDAWMMDGWCNEKIFWPQAKRTWESLIPVESPALVLYIVVLERFNFYDTPTCSIQLNQVVNNLSEDFSS
jgi:hypothetical protein